MPYLHISLCFPTAKRLSAYKFDQYLGLMLPIVKKRQPSLCFDTYEPMGLTTSILS